MKTLITGANGNVSSGVLRALVDAPDVKLRALVRDSSKAPDLPGVEVAVADLDHPDTLTDAFAAVDTVWLLNPMGPQAPHASMNAVWAARQAGVRHVVRLSAIGAAYDAPTRNGRLHALSDNELRGSGLAWTIIKPSSFMQNLLGSVAGNTLYGGFGDGRVGLIDARDIADFAARILTEPQAHAGKTYTITGPESLSLDEAAKILGSVLERSMTAHPMTDEQLHQAVVGAGFPDWFGEVSVEYAKAFGGGWANYTTSDFANVMGHQARSFADFARDHAQILR